MLVAVFRGELSGHFENDFSIDFFEFPINGWVFFFFGLKIPCREKVKNFAVRSICNNLDHISIRHAIIANNKAGPGLIRDHERELNQALDPIPHNVDVVSWCSLITLACRRG